VQNFAKSGVLEALEIGDLISAAGLPIPWKAQPPTFINSVALRMSLGEIHILGKARTPRPKEEAFFLVAEPFNFSQWLAQASNNDWKPIDLAPRLRVLSEHPRNIEIYVDPDDVDDPLSSSSLYCAGLRVTSLKNAILFYATPEHPTAVELCHEEPRQVEILESLVKWNPQQSKFA